MNKVVYPEVIKITKGPNNVFEISFAHEGETHSLRRQGLDDSLLIIAAVFNTGSTISCLRSIAGDAAHL